MQIQLRSRGSSVTDAMRTWTERRVLFALGQFSGRVRTVRVTLTDENGPRGGVEPIEQKDGGEDAGPGRLWFTMRYVDGVDVAVASVPGPSSVPFLISRCASPSDFASFGSLAPPKRTRTITRTMMSSVGPRFMGSP